MKQQIKNNVGAQQTEMGERIKLLIICCFFTVESSKTCFHDALLFLVLFFHCLSFVIVVIECITVCSIYIFLLPKY